MRNPKEANDIQFSRGGKKIFVCQLRGWLFLLMNMGTEEAECVTILKQS